MLISLTSLVAVFTIIMVKGVSADAKAADKYFEVIIGGGGGVTEATPTNLSKFL